MLSTARSPSKASASISLDVLPVDFSLNSAGLFARGTRSFPGAQNYFYCCPQAQLVIRWCQQKCKNIIPVVTFALIYKLKEISYSVGLYIKLERISQQIHNVILNCGFFYFILKFSKTYYHTSVSPYPKPRNTLYFMLWGNTGESRWGLLTLHCDLDCY